jgi:hypothetical protein
MAWGATQEAKAGKWEGGLRKGGRGKGIKEELGKGIKVGY